MKNIDPHSKIKQSSRWAEKGSGKTETAESRQKKILEKAKEIAKNKNSKKD
ncbi:MAG TPA: hypothetical protein VHO03_07560 [Ignavibacteriales bacterium]|nr:hypothetical protein [Ignavibacteriales bacterium]